LEKKKEKRSGVGLIPCEMKQANANPREKDTEIPDP